MHATAGVSPKEEAVYHAKTEKTETDVPGHCGNHGKSGGNHSNRSEIRYRSWSHLQKTRPVLFVPLHCYFKFPLSIRRPTIRKTPDVRYNVQKNTFLWSFDKWNDLCSLHA